MAYGSDLQRRLFYAGPAFVKDAMTSVYGWRQRRDRHGKYYRAALESLERSQYEPNAALIEWQIGQLRRFLTEAATHSPYYARMFQAAGFRPEALSGRDLSFLPFLTKDLLREQMPNILADDLDRRAVRWSRTSGTSGKALVFPLPIETFQREHAFRTLHYRWGGVDPHRREKIAICAGHPVAHHDREKPPFWSHDAANRTLLLSSYHLSEANLPHYVRKLVEYQPALIAGYPSSVYLLALAAERVAPGRIRPKTVICSSETFFDFQRAAIERAFGCRGLMWYGTSEMTANIVECGHGRKHLKLEHGFVEILNDRNDPASPGEEARLVCTPFFNSAMPMIRYDIGDIVTLSAETECPCRRSGLLIESVIGRREDYIVTPDGRFVGRLDHLFKDAVNVQEAQIVQDTPDEATLRLVVNDRYGETDEKEILDEARVRLGSAIRIRFEYVASIPRTANGKFRFIVSNVERKRVFGQEIESKEFE